MKIFAIGRNYIEHNRELNNPAPKQPVVFMKPETALLKNKKIFYYPDFSSEVHYEGELVLKVCRLGKHIQETFANKYYAQVTVGIDFTARDIQNECKKEGLPWELAKAFDGSAAVGKFIDLKELPDPNNINFTLKRNGKNVQRGNSKDMLFNFEHIISFISKYFTIKLGDLIFTGTPAGVGPVKTGDIYEGYIGNKKLLETKIR